MLVNLEQQVQQFTVELVCDPALDSAKGCRNARVYPTSGTVGTLKKVYIYAIFNSSEVEAKRYHFYLNITTYYEIAEYTDDGAEVMSDERAIHESNVQVPWTVTVTSRASARTTTPEISSEGPILNSEYKIYIVPVRTPPRRRPHAPAISARHRSDS